MANLKIGPSILLYEAPDVNRFMSVYTLLPLGLIQPQKKMEEDLLPSGWPDQIRG